MYGEPLEAVANGLRHALIAADEKTFAVGDFAKIEAVIVLALAGATTTAANVIKNGSAVYTDMAAKIFHHPVKKDDYKEYTIGKNSILGCGFQMGWVKFKARYWKDAEDDEAKEVIRIYREDFAPEVPKLWRALEDAARETVWTGRPHEAYGVTYKLEDGWLTARLPSGRKLWYYDPKPIRKAMPWDRNDIRPAWSYMAYKQGQWRRVDAYGGLLTENVVQATARDLLVAGVFRCEENDYPVVLTVHDEIVAELDRARASVQEFKQLMIEGTPWSRALQIPLDADCWIGERYRK
jgi:DNA polymerase